MSSILIADDHAVVRMALRMTLENAGHTVIAEVGCGTDVILRAREMNPDLIILDIDMPKLDGMGVLRHICGDFKSLIFSALNAEQYAVRCIRAGAAGFVSKDSELSELLKAVQLILAGYILYPSEFSDFVRDEASVVTQLSARELTVIRYMTRGYRIKEMAEEMVMSAKTVSSYKSRLMTKLQVNNSVELVEFARRNGLI